MADSKTPKLSQEQFFEYLRFDKMCKDVELENVRQSVAQSDIPLSEELLARVLRLFITDALDVLRGHAGFVFVERRKHYRASLSIMLLSLDDLEAALVNFEQLATSDQADIMLPRNAKKLEAIERRIQKELFSTANAAASLVDHVRRLQLRFEFPGFQKQLQECFGDDGLHDLIIGLRVLLHHLHIVEAGWSLSSDFTTGSRSARFKIDRAELKRAISQSGERFEGQKGEPMRKFVSECLEQIDLSQLFGEYRSRLDRFYDWLNREIETAPPPALQDYDRCILEKDRHSSRMMWNAMIGNFLNWERVPDVHKRLPDYLSGKQLEAVYRLPRNSKEQADLIIEYADTYGAVDDKLRGSVYQLLERLSMQEAKKME